MYLENLINKVKLPFRKDKELYRRLYAILGFYPKDISYYKEALQHKSLSFKTKGPRLENNERLEFLGDAILDAIVGDIVYRHFKGKREGFLTNTRSKIVQRETLGKLAVEMGIDKLVRYSGQSNSPHSFMAGNAFEALVGAIYLDYGYARCMQFMKQRVLSALLDIDKVAYQEVNFKSKLLEWSQKNRIRLVFNDQEQRNSNNGSTFFSDVVIEGITCGTGKGFSKKEAQQNAAKDALYQLKKQKGLEQSIFDAKGKRTAMEEQPQALLPEIPEELLQPTQNEQPVKKEQLARKEKPAKREKPAKKEQTTKKEQPTKKEQTTKKEQPTKKEQVVKKENNAPKTEQSKEEPPKQTGETQESVKPARKKRSTPRRKSEKDERTEKVEKVENVEKVETVEKKGVPGVEQPAEPAVKPTTEPAVKPIAETPTEPATEEAAIPIAEASAEPATKPDAARPAIDETSAEPATEQKKPRRRHGHRLKTTIKPDAPKTENK